MLNSLDNDTIALEYADKLSREELEKLFAIKAVVSNPSIVNNVMVFEKLCLALNGVIPSFEHVEMPNTLMVCGALKVLKDNDIDIKNLSETVKKYIACIAFDDGFVVLPEIAKFAQSFLDRLVSDFAKELFQEVTLEILNTKQPWDDEDPISNHCAKIQAVNLYLNSIGNEQ